MEDEIKKREQRSFYFVAENVKKFDSAKQVEEYLNANGKKDEQEIVFGEKRSFAVVKSFKITK